MQNTYYHISGVVIIINDTLANSPDVIYSEITEFNYLINQLNSLKHSIEEYLS
jgi:glycine cleavage system H lipoate-binding protein